MAAMLYAPWFWALFGLLHGFWSWAQQKVGWKTLLLIHLQKMRLLRELLARRLMQLDADAADGDTAN